MKSTFRSESLEYPHSPKTDKKPAYLDIENQVLPALQSNAGNNNPPEYAPGEEFNEEEAKNGEPIAVEHWAAAEPLVEVFGEPINRLIFSRSWTLRERGISEIEEWVLNSNSFE